MLEAGVHFGHHTSRWHPKMKPFIFGQRAGVHIIDLEKTASQLEVAAKFLEQLVKEEKQILFVGTKRQAQEVIGREAIRAGCPYINKRWFGGLLTNFKTIKKSISRLKKLEEMFGTGEAQKYTKKEQLGLEVELRKLKESFGGITEMNEVPGAIFVLDVGAEHIAVKEAKNLGVPIVGIVDTNCSPEGITYLIPANDDGKKAISTMVSKIADIIIGAKGKRVEKVEPKEGEEEEEKVALPEEVEEIEEKLEEEIVAEEAGKIKKAKLAE